MPKAQRSRACQQCRERRVKCDETPELCQQCRRLGLTCSGPIQGSVIIDMTDRVAKPRQRKKREPATRPPIVIRGNASAELMVKQVVIPKLEPDRMVSPSALQLVPQDWKPAFDQWNEIEASEAIATIRHQYRPPSIYQPSKIIPEALDLAFVSHFVQLNQGVRSFSPEIPWITHLPDLHGKATKPALKLSIRAASMAFYATMHRDTTILVDSYRWYTMSLNSQRQSLAKLGTQSVPSREEIIVPIILSLYEVFAGTNSTSIWHHLTAATNIIAMRGPSNCKGAAFPIFKAMRVSDAHTAVVFNHPSIFAAPEWMTVPFQGQVRNAHQHLADILLVIPETVALCRMSGSMRSAFSKPVRLNVDLRPAEERIRQLFQRLDDWATRFPNLTVAAGGEQVVAADMESLATSGARPATLDKSFLVLPSSFVALTAATYEAIRLILSLLLHKITLQALESRTDSLGTNASALPGSTTSTLFETAVTSSKAILKISANMESTHPVGFDFMRSVFPPVIVASIGPLEEEKTIANEMLERWGSKRGMGGLCAAWINI